jgi:hypothetical protein
LDVDDGTSSDNGDIDDLMVVDSLDIDLSTGFVYNAYVVASNTAVGAAVNEGTSSNGTMVGSHINGLGHVFLSEDLAVDVDVLAGCRRDGLVDRRREHTL